MAAGAAPVAEVLEAEAVAEGAPPRPAAAPLEVAAEAARVAVQGVAAEAVAAAGAAEASSAVSVAFLLRYTLCARRESLATG